MFTYETLTLTGRRLNAFGKKFAVDYTFSPCVSELAYGRYGELSLPGMQLTCSDFAIHNTYYSCSKHDVAWLICLPLYGQIEVRHGYYPTENYHLLSAGQCMAVHFTNAAPLYVVHKPQPRLLILTLAVFSPMVFNLTIADVPQRHICTLPPSFLPHILQALNRPLASQLDDLNWQGIALQLLAHALPPNHDFSNTSALSSRDFEQLRALHRRIREYPAADYCLAHLAKEAAMSISSLRQKFQRCYGRSIFAYIRQCRLEQAYADLLQGQSIEQVAHTYGYTYSSNFAQAFKRSFGLTPQQLRQTLRKRGWCHRA